MQDFLNTTISAAALATVVLLTPARADEAPAFIQNTFPEQAVDAAWQEYQAVFLDPDAALDVKTKELIALAISGQVPCDYCVFYHRRAAEAQGATEAEIREALASAALVRKWSTMLNGSQYDAQQWRAEVDAMFEQ
jgi:AhpD family alkylhydroperoxidase